LDIDKPIVFIWIVYQHWHKIGYSHCFRVNGMTRISPQISTKLGIIVPVVVIVQPGFVIIVLARIYYDTLKSISNVRSSGISGALSNRTL
jgi:hypothetical protein